MAHLLVVVVDRIEQSPEILKAWMEAGVSGATVLESAGLARFHGALTDDTPLLPSLGDILASREEHHRTLFTVIEDDATLERAIAAAERVVGSFEEHHTGILFVVPVSLARGLRRDKPQGPRWQP